MTLVACAPVRDIKHQPNAWLPAPPLRGQVWVLVKVKQPALATHNMHPQQLSHTCIALQNMHCSALLLATSRPSRRANPPGPAYLQKAVKEEILKAGRRMDSLELRPLPYPVEVEQSVLARVHVQCREWHLCSASSRGSGAGVGSVGVRMSGPPPGMKPVHLHRMEGRSDPRRALQMARGSSTCMRASEGGRGGKRGDEFESGRPGARDLGRE